MHRSSCKIYIYIYIYIYYEVTETTTKDVSFKNFFNHRELTTNSNNE